MAQPPLCTSSKLRIESLKHVSNDTFLGAALDTQWNCAALPTFWDNEEDNVTELCSRLCGVDLPDPQRMSDVLIHHMTSVSECRCYLPLLSTKKAYSISISCCMILEVLIRSESEKLSKSKKVSILLTDLIRELGSRLPEHKQQIATLIHAIIGHPRGLNLRNLFAHGFLLPGVSPEIDGFLLKATSMLCLLCLQVFKTFGGDIELDWNGTNVLHLAQDVVDVPSEWSGGVNEAVTLRPNFPGLSLLLLFPLAEMFLRQKFAAVNTNWLQEQDGMLDMKIAQDTVVYYTLSELLSPMLDVATPNRVFNDTSASGVAWYGLLISPLGPMLRDRLFHAKLSPVEVDNEMVDIIWDTVMNMLRGEGCSQSDIPLGMPQYEASCRIQNLLMKLTAFENQSMEQEPETILNHLGTLDGKTHSRATCTTLFEVQLALRKKLCVPVSELAPALLLQLDEYKAAKPPIQDARLIQTVQFPTTIAVSCAIHRCVGALQDVWKQALDVKARYVEKISSGSARSTHRRSAEVVARLLPVLNLSFTVLLWKWQSLMASTSIEVLVKDERTLGKMSSQLKTGSKPFGLSLVDCLCML